MAKTNWWVKRGISNFRTLFLRQPCYALAPGYFASGECRMNASRESRSCARLPHRSTVREVVDFRQELLIPYPHRVGKENVTHFARKTRFRQSHQESHRTARERLARLE